MELQFLQNEVRMENDLLLNRKLCCQKISLEERRRIERRLSLEILKMKGCELNTMQLIN